MKRALVANARRKWEGEGGERGRGAGEGVGQGGRLVVGARHGVERPLDGLRIVQGNGVTG